MIQFANTETSVEFILTLTELVTVNEPIYDFVFTHVLTKEQVTFSLTNDDDNSDFPNRYNSFTIDVTQFDKVGEWHYVVTENQTGIVLEQGKMIITRAFNYTKYAGTTSYTAYSG
jgi:hypothetical protein